MVSSMTGLVGSYLAGGLGCTLAGGRGCILAGRTSCAGAEGLGWRLSGCRSLYVRWHILSIPLTTGRGISAETCGLDDVFPPDDLGSRPEALCKYIYIYMYFPYTSSVIGRIYNGIVIQYWRSCTPSGSIGECAVPGLNAILCFLWFTNCVLLFDKNLLLGCLWHLVFV